MKVVVVSSNGWHNARLLDAAGNVVSQCPRQNVAEAVRELRIKTTIRTETPGAAEAFAAYEAEQTKGSKKP